MDAQPWKTQPTLDRLGEARGSLDSLKALWQEPSARLLVVDASGRVAAATGTGPDDFGTSIALQSDSFDSARDVLLGRSEGVAWFCRRADLSAPGVSLRDGDFTAAQTELVAAATAVLAWHDGAGFCERCGQPSTMALGGFHRLCSNGHQIFPRTDPAMIVAVLDEQDRLLLAHQASWPEGRVSVLAGFLESGESAEHAVVREVREESGLEVVDVAYVTSQPWPYPRSLMLAFAARARGEVRVDGQEIAWGRWYTPDELTAAQADGLVIPGLGSVAGRLVQAWRTGTLHQAAQLSRDGA